ncbi:MAG: cellulase family glycosylhydrolase, partial [Planctomycetaceae bacterium]|nr:cellulase family glycosylhydrolase [Planctomycetaceae bacterium]
MSYFRCFLLFAILGLAVPAGCVSAQTVEEEFPPLFPFVISFDAPENITNISSQRDAPAGKHGFVRVRDGHFVTDNGMIRFWGTNLCFTANFPTKEQADKLADRLARFGYNCVRLHHLDTGNSSLVNGQLTLTEMDRRKLDALDYLIAALKKRGIYVNINLHVGRWLDDRDGFPYREQRPDYDKGIGNFEPRMIELQKQYARDLLTHVNPYTKLAAAQDPCVAMVEISNEDSIVSEWSGGRMDSLPEPYGGLLRKLWNDWLREKYVSTEQLREAWNSQIIPLGDEMYPDLNFETDRSLLSRRLVLQTDGKSKAAMWVVDKTLKLKVTEMGESAWIPQIFYTNVSISKDDAYTLSLRMRSDMETTVTFGVRRNTEPWDYLGGQRRVSLTPEWQTFDVSFYATDTFDNARIDVGGFSAGVIYEIDNISLRPGGAFGLKADQTLEAGNVPMISPFHSDALPVMTRDFVEFLFRIEQDYWGGMYDFLKNDLKVQAPVTGTQMNYGSMIVQSQLDYCDNHSYWNHPSFPGRDWDMSNWYVRNISLANSADTGTLTRLAMHRVLGKPYTVSEYDHPFPNEYNAEGQPMIAAMGRFQDWDGIFPFAYSHSNNFEPDYVTSFFDSVGNVGRIAHTIACHTMFVRGDVTVAEKQYGVGLTMPQEIDIVANARSPWMSRWAGTANEGNRLALMYAVGV